MLKRIVILISAVLMISVPAVGIAQADNTRGQCTSYFNGKGDKGGDDAGGQRGDILDAANEYDEMTFPEDGDTNGDGEVNEDDDINGDGEIDNTDYENLTDASGVWGERHESSDMYEYCTQDDEDNIGGNGEHNGRFDCEEPGEAGRDFDGDGEIECYDNQGPDEVPVWRITQINEDGSLDMEPYDGDGDENQDNANVGDDHPGKGKGRNK